MNTEVCVFTGDIIASTKASPERLERALGAVSEAAERLEKWWPAGPTARFTRFRGDGWHFVLSDPRRAFRAAIYIAARLAAADTGLSTRMSIGIGPAVSFGTTNLADASGEAFQISGRGLDAMKRGRKMSIEGHKVAPLQKAILLLASERCTRWSKEQAEAVAICLLSDALTQADAANKLGISPQAVNARLSGAGFQAIQDSIDIWENPQMHTFNSGLTP